MRSNFTTGLRSGIVGFLACLLAAATGAAAKEAFDRPQVENDRILMRLIPHAPDQMAAFYEGRGFPKPAIAKIREACFITVHIENKSNDIVWLEPERWRILGSRGGLSRLDRAYWRKQWDAVNLPPANRSTFGWTLLPERRDLRPGEPVGGNITLPRTQEAFSIEARFMTGARQRKDMLQVLFKNIHCPPNRDAP